MSVKAFKKLIDDYWTDTITSDDVIATLKNTPKKEVSALYYELLDLVGFAPCVEYITPEQLKLLNLLVDESIYPDSYWDEFDPFAP